MRGSIQKRGKESWRYVFDAKRGAEGRRKQIVGTIRAKTKKEAQQKLREIISEYEHGGFIEPSTITLATYLEKWLLVIKPSVSPKTFERYAQMVRTNLVPALGGVPLQHLKTIHIQNAYSEMLQSARRDGKDGGLKPKTVRNIHGLLNRALRQAIAWELTSNNPSSAVVLPKVERTEVEVLTKRQAATLLRAIEGHWLYPIVLLALTTGMRRGEICGLKWSNVNLDEGWLQVVHSMEQTNEGLRLKDVKTKYGRRKISLPQVTVRMLRSHMAKQSEELLRLGVGKKNDRLVFMTQHGRERSPWLVTNEFGNFVKKLEITPITFHGLRHTHITHLLEDGHPIKTVSARAGHASVSITLDIYAHVLPDRQEHLAAAYGAELERELERFENEF